MTYTTGSKIAQWVGWAIVILYLLGFLFWAGTGIYVAADKPENLEHILFSTLNILPLGFLVLFLLRLFSSGDDWWEKGVPAKIYVVGFGVLSAAGMLASLFVMLRSILDSQFNNDTDENLLIALDAVLFAISVVSFLYQLVCGVVVLFIRRPKFMRIKQMGAPLNQQPMQKRTTMFTRNKMVNKSPY